jgi:TonB family protein
MAFQAALICIWRCTRVDHFCSCCFTPDDSVFFNRLQRDGGSLERMKMINKGCCTRIVAASLVVLVLASCSPIETHQQSNQTVGPSIDVSKVEAGPIKEKPLMVSDARYKSPPKIQFPLGAIERDQEGKVTTRVLVDETGAVTSVYVTVSSGIKNLDNAAVDALKKSSFYPYIVNGKPISFFTVAEVNFKLE